MNMICSTLSGKLSIKHPCGLMVREDGMVLNRVKGKFKDLSKRYSYTHGHSDKDGYMILTYLSKPYKVHRLVAECFIPNTEGKETVDHIDHNRANNQYQNLRWATRTEQAYNRIHKYDFQYTDRKSYQKAYRELTKTQRLLRR